MSRAPCRKRSLFPTRRARSRHKATAANGGQPPLPATLGVPLAPGGALVRASSCRRSRRPIFVRKGREDFKAWSAERRSLATQPADNLESLYFASFASFAENFLIHILAACLVKTDSVREFSRRIH